MPWFIGFWFGLHLNWFKFEYHSFFCKKVFGFAKICCSIGLLATNLNWFESVQKFLFLRGCFDSSGQGRGLSGVEIMGRRLMDYCPVSHIQGTGEY